MVIRKKREDKEIPVRKACLNRLSVWKLRGFVVDYDDVSALGKRQIRGKWRMDTEIGKRDIIAIIKDIKNKNKAWVYLIETKAPDGGIWSKEQQEYAKRFAWLDNVIYEVVNDPNQVDITIGNITGYTPEKLMNKL